MRIQIKLGPSNTYRDEGVRRGTQNFFRFAASVGWGDCDVEADPARPHALELVTPKVNPDKTFKGIAERVAFILEGSLLYALVQENVEVER
ncbi:MAG: hypothetical protein EBR82_32100 [Caulobacteraceae bacterium]|nr:hypothetical protein [Caulobacteraceae bacterium]